MKNVVAVILGGGQGTRLFPLTKLRSKPAVPLAGKYRLIDIPISNCINSEVRKIFVLTQFNSESLNRHISETYRFDMFSEGFVDILAAEQTIESRDWFQGTADAVRRTLRHFVSKNIDYILILSGDHLYKMDYRKFINYHIEKNADITIGTIPVDEEEASSFGIMKIDSNFRIKSFSEKPKGELLKSMKSNLSEFLKDNKSGVKKEYLASMGIYVFNKEVLIELLKSYNFLDFGKEVIPFAIRNKRVFSYMFNGYWSDIGTIRSFYEANLKLTEPKPVIDLYDAESPIYTHARFLPSSKIVSCKILNSIISEGCILNGASIRNSIVGIRAKIGRGSEINNSIVMGADYYESVEELNHNRDEGIPDVGIGNNCVIQGAIIDKNVRIGDNVLITNFKKIQNLDRDFLYIRDGIVVIPKNAIIPNNFVL